MIYVSFHSKQKKKICFLSLHLVERDLALQSQEALKRVVMSNPG